MQAMLPASRTDLEKFAIPQFDLQREDVVNLWDELGS